MKIKIWLVPCTSIRYASQWNARVLQLAKAHRSMTKASGLPGVFFFRSIQMNELRGTFLNDNNNNNIIFLFHYELCVQWANFNYNPKRKFDFKAKLVQISFNIVFSIPFFFLIPFHFMLFPERSRFGCLGWSI